MTSLDDPTVKSKYQKCKFRVKHWESNFLEKHGRMPSKNDIRDADIVIKEAYKMYWKLKTQALEETLLDITFSDEVVTNVSVNSSFNKLLPSENIGNFLNENIHMSLSKNIENIIPGASTMTNDSGVTSPLKNNSIANLPLKKDSINVCGVWSDHLNKDNATPKKKRAPSFSKSTSFQLSQKKFTSSFSKRNPRKSLSTSRLRNKLDFNSLTVQDQNSCDVKLETINSMESVVGGPIRLTHQDVKICAQPLNPIQQLINGDGTVGPERHVNINWLERCIDKNDLERTTSNQQRLSSINDSGTDSMDLSDHALQGITTIDKDKFVEIFEDDDFVCNSDTEENGKNKRIRNWRKSLSDITCQPTKRLRIETSSVMTDNLSLNYVPKNLKITFSNDVIGNYTPEIVKIIQDEMINESTEIKKDGNVLIKMNPKEIHEVERSNTKKSPACKSKINDSNDEIHESIVQEPRVTRSKLITKNRSTSQKRKLVPFNQVTRRTNRKSDSTENEQIMLNETKDPEIPIYGVEYMEVVPRFSVPTNTNGDLIQEFSQSVIVQEVSTLTNKRVTIPKNAMIAKEKFEAKVAAGKVNENFVRINLKKKIFTRGKKSFNFSRYKKNEWKNKKKELASSEGSLDLADLAEKNTCFKCGGNNHKSKECTALKSDELLPLDENYILDCPTLEEAEIIASQETIHIQAQINKLPKYLSSGSSTAKKLDSSLRVEDENFRFFNGTDVDKEFKLEKQAPMVGCKVPENLVKILLPPVDRIIDPLYPATADGSVIETPSEVFETLKMFGYECFRPGQEKAIMRILTGQSTLVTLSTGSGKSLCYQLPAYLYARRSHCITLVVSPLVSLMDDQVTGIPEFLSAAALHTGQSPRVREEIIETVKKGKLDILLISPETVVACEKSTGFRSLLRQLPPIAFVCIDEAHCISQWSHNFRPSYLMICRVLMEKMNVKTILGLTATATINTTESIVSHLRIHDGLHGVISDAPLPQNLILTVSKDDQRDRALIDLLKSKRFEQCNSIIIYCTRREECTRIAVFLRVLLQDTIDPLKLKSKVKVSPIAEAYHAGLGSGRRKVIQKAFMKGDIRIVVATVAFGMGINKSNIRSVIHYNMPSSFEGYVQEVGRAGRDNLPAHCHLFLSPKEDSDKWELRRHIYVDGVDRHTIRRLLQKIFIPCSCSSNNRKCPGHEVAIPINETVHALDISKETISTLLCYLELHPKKFITVLSSVYVNAKVSSYNGPKALKVAAQSSPPLAMAFALNKKRGIDHENSSIVEFPIIDVAALIGWDSGIVKSHLKNLEWDKSDGKYKRTCISVRYDTLGLRVRAPGDLTDAELDEALDALSERSRSQQISALQQLETIHASLNNYSYSNVSDCFELNDEKLTNSEQLKDVIRQYFKFNSFLSTIDISPKISDKTNEDQIVNDIRSLICSYRDNNFTGRAIARIFYGIQSPNYSALNWSRCRFWRAHLSTDFDWIVQIASREILSMR